MSKKYLSLLIILPFAVFFISMFFSFLVYFGLINEFGVPYYNGGGSDDYIYEQDAKQFKNHFGWYDKEYVRQVLGNPFHNSTGFVWFLSKFVYYVDKISNYDTMHFRIFNCFVLSLTSLFFFSCIRTLDVFKLKESFYIALVSFTLPFVLYINSFIFRDTIILFLVVLYLYFLQVFYKCLLHKTKINVLLVCTICIAFCCVLMYPMRIQYSVVFGIVYLFVIFYRFKGKLNGKLSLIFMSALVASLFFILFSIGLIDQLLKMIYLYQDYVAGNSQGFTSFIFNQPLPITAILRIVFSPFYPIPEIGFGHKLLIFINIFFQAIFFPVIVFGFFRLFKTPYSAPLLVLFIFIYLGVVWGTYTFRHFFYISPFYPLFFYYGYKNIRNFNLYTVPVLFLIVIVISFFMIRLSQ